MRIIEDTVYKIYEVMVMGSEQEGARAKFKRVNSFRYLGVTTSNGETTEEIKESVNKSRIKCHTLYIIYVI